MHAEELKRKMREILGEQIIFNKEFDDLAESIKNLDEDFLSWCVLIRERKLPAIAKTVLGNKVVFIKKIGSSNRCLIIKIKNDGFTEVHLGDHKYYDELRKKLGLKTSSYTS